MPETPKPGRPQSGYVSDYEDLRPDEDGAPPRPRNEPEGSAESEQSDKLLTDPGSGEARDDAQAPNQGPRVD